MRPLRALLWAGFALTLGLFTFAAFMDDLGGLASVPMKWLAPFYAQVVGVWRHWLGLPYPGYETVCGTSWWNCVAVEQPATPFGNIAVGLFLGSAAFWFLLRASPRGPAVAARCAVMYSSLVLLLFEASIIATQPWTFFIHATYSTEFLGPLAWNSTVAAAAALAFIGLRHYGWRVR